MAVLSAVDLATKIRLLTGATFWSTHELPELGLAEMIVSDGPCGVRGVVFDERDNSVAMPSATCLAATWDVALARRYGRTLAAEAIGKGVRVVLGPTINLHRTPYGGRHFEAFSEDPVLTGEIAAAYVRGLQAEGVGACPKHYVANDSETDRMTVDVQIDERTLHEVYLAPFKRCVEAGAWSVMSAYNSVNGATMTESPLLAEPLKGEWGFDGVVISDWTAVRTVSPSANAEQDLVFPGPASPWTEGLLEAVEAGEVDPSAIERKVDRILRLAERTGALGSTAPAERPESREAARLLARQVAAAGAVLVRNDGLLPLPPEVTIALSGHSAVTARIQGGGSAIVYPEYEISPADGLREAFGDRISVSTGAVVHDDVRPFPASRMPGGMTATFRGADHRERFSETRLTSQVAWFAPFVAESTHVVLDAEVLPDADGELPLALHLIGHARVEIDGREIWSGYLQGEGTDLGGSHRVPGTIDLDLTVTPGVPVAVRVVHELTKGNGQFDEHLYLVLGERPRGDSAALIAEAADRARQAEVAVVVVGTNAHVESEGRDRADLRLPGRQDDLIEAVIAANPRTVVVVNAGSPILMPWRDRAAAVVVTWFGGQEMGRALADLLTGVVEPGGRLPTTWPATETEVPVREVTPTDGTLSYREGLHLGYRAWLRSGAVPAYPFGHGLGYTTWSLDDAHVDSTAAGTSVAVHLTNTGSRSGRQVVQIYAARPDSVHERPELWLVGFATVDAAPGERVRVTVGIDVRDLDVRVDGAWLREPGRYTLHIGFSASDLPMVRTLALRADPIAPTTDPR